MKPKPPIFILLLLFCTFGYSQSYKVKVRFGFFKNAKLNKLENVNIFLISDRNCYPCVEEIYAYLETNKNVAKRTIIVYRLKDNVYQNFYIKKQVKAIPNLHKRWYSKLDTPEEKNFFKQFNCTTTPALIQVNEKGEITFFEYTKLFHGREPMNASIKAGLYKKE